MNTLSNFLEYNNSLNKFFNQIYVINLKHRTDRLEIVKLWTERYGVDVLIWKGIDGNQLTSKDLEGYPTPSFKPNHKGYVALNLTTIEIVKDAKEKGYKNILILEDDIEWDSDVMEVFKDNIDNIPKDYSMLWLGCLPELATSKIKGRIHYIRGCTYGHAYSIQSNIYDEFIEDLSKMDKQNDVILREYSLKRNDLKGYGFMPPIVQQMDGLSSINGHHVLRKTVS